MRIHLNSVFVEDQEKALTFYTEILGFVKKADVPVGKYKWLTVVSPDDTEGTELLLEPNANEAARKFQQSIYKQGIPITSFAVDNIHEEYEKLQNLGVEFNVPPTDVGSAQIAVFDDTFGNLIQIVQT